MTRTPELIVEIVSPERARRDEVIKFDLYRQEGVRHYILVYPEAQKAKVYNLTGNEYIKVGDFFDEKYSFVLSKCSFDFDFARIWPN